MPRKRKPTGRTRIDPQKASVLVKIYKQADFYVSRQTSTHIIMRRDKQPRSLSIPDHQGREVQPPIIKSLNKIAGISRDKYLEYLSNVK